MSKEELINFWKNEVQPGKKPAAPRKKPAQTPANPAGEQELSDEDLALIEGGLLNQDSQGDKCSCVQNTCN